MVRGRGEATEEPQALRSVYVTFGDEASARRIANVLVTERLIACANIFPLRSVFRWDGVIKDEAEWAALLKTTSDRVDALTARRQGLHDYDVPCIVVLEPSWALPTD